MLASNGSDAEVLVVDDDEAVARLVRAVLERAGFAVHHVLDAEQALVALAERHCRLVVTDFTMPDMDGLQLVRAAEAAGHTAAFLVMSAYLEPAVLQRLCEEPAVAGVLGKPFELSALVRDVRAVLAEGATVRKAALGPSAVAQAALSADACSPGGTWCAAGPQSGTAQGGDGPSC